jgi:hypothetical protein
MFRLSLLSSLRVYWRALVLLAALGSAGIEQTRVLEVADNWETSSSLSPDSLRCSYSCSASGILLAGLPYLLLFISFALVGVEAGARGCKHVGIAIAHRHSMRYRSRAVFK